MDILIEFILELLFEVGNEVASNKNISKWIRYPIIAIFALISIAVIGGIIILGISMIKESLLLALILIAIGLILLICGIFKFRKKYKEKYL